MKRLLPNHPYFKTIQWVEIESTEGLMRVVPEFMRHLEKKATYRQIQWVIDWWVATGLRTDKAFAKDEPISADQRTWPINSKAFKKTKNSKLTQVMYKGQAFTAVSYEVKNILDEKYREGASITESLVHKVNYEFAFRGSVKREKKPSDLDEIKSYIKQQYGKIAARKRPLKIQLHEKLKATYPHGKSQEFLNLSAGSLGKTGLQKS